MGEAVGVAVGVVVGAGVLLEPLLTATERLADVGGFGEGGSPCVATEVMVGACDLSHDSCREAMVRFGFLTPRGCLYGRVCVVVCVVA